MPAPVATITALVPWALAHAATAHGANPTPLWATLGLSPATPPALETHVPIRVHLALWQQVMRDLRDPELPLALGAASKIEDLEVFGFLALTSADLGDAYARTAGVRKLWATGARWELDDEPGGVRLTWYGWPAPPDLALGARCASELQAVDMLNAIRQIAGRPLVCIDVAMPHAPSPARDALARFFGTQVRWSAPQLSLLLPAGCTRWPVAQFNSRLRDYFQQQCNNLLQTFADDAPVTAQVRKLLVQGMDGRVPTMDQVARSMALSTRSLQRKLAEEGASLQTLIDDVRAELAKRYLARPNMSASEVSYLVGFANTSAFFKAFKRWTGTTPKTFQAARAD